jgi:hypothetical protein
LLAITTDSLPSMTETQLFVVPKSIPIIFPILFCIINYYKLKFCLWLSINMPKEIWTEILPDCHFRSKK